MQQSIVFYPVPAMGHLIPMVEFGKRLLLRRPSSCTVTVLLASSDFSGFGLHAASVNSYLRRTSQSYPSISFLRLPPVTLNPTTPHSAAATCYEFLRRNTRHVASALNHISQTSHISAFVFDLLCTSALHVACSLGIPAYQFFTAGAAILAAFSYFPIIHQQTHESFKDIHDDVELEFPGNPPLMSRHMVTPMLDRDDPAYWDMLDFFTNISKAEGIIVNTFQEMEPKAVKAVTDGTCFPDPKEAPRVYYVGPLVCEPKSNDDEYECVRWVEKQGKRSVVYLSFGSLGWFTVAQLKEIAVALERSDQRFLWVVKRPLDDDDEEEEFELKRVLPQGFLERTKEKGMVVKSWAPQVEVLSKESVGGFVTHCGWNSVMEAVVAGVPMIAWPLYAEQHLNRNVMVEDMKIAIGLEQRKEDGFVSGEELEKKVRELMESQKGKEMRDRSFKMRDMAMSAMAASGSSTKALDKLVQRWNINGH